MTGTLAADRPYMHHTPSTVAAPARDHYLLVQVPQAQLQIWQQQPHCEVLQYPGYGFEVSMAQCSAQALPDTCSSSP